MLLVSLFTPRASQQTTIQRSKLSSVHPMQFGMRPTAKDSFQRFSGIDSARANLADWEASGNPGYLRAKGWAEYQSPARRKWLLSDGGKNLTDKAIAALIQLEEGTNQSQEEIVVESQEMITVQQPKPQVVVPQVSIPGPIMAQNYTPFNETKPRRRALPETELDKISRDLRIACAVYEYYNDLVSRTSETDKDHAYSKRQNVGYRWKVGNTDF